MPYKNIVFIQLQKRLLNDPRWYMMSYTAQLLLIKIWLALSHFDNRLTKDEVDLTSILRMDLPIGEIRGALQEIKKKYPNFKSNKHFYYWKDFNEYTNYIPKGKSQGKPREIPSTEHIDIHIDTDIHRDIDIHKDLPAKPGYSENLTKKLDLVYKDGFNIYALINKMKLTFKQRPGFQFPEPVLDEICQAYWKDKAQISEPWPWFARVLADRWTQWNANQNIQEHEIVKKQGGLSIAQILEGIQKGGLHGDK